MLGFLKLHWLSLSQFAEAAGAYARQTQATANGSSFRGIDGHGYQCPPALASTVADSARLAARFSKSRRPRRAKLMRKETDTMASIHREIVIEVSPELAWDALRDIGALHTRLAPGFVTDVKLEQGARLVTFGNGRVARELIIDVDDERRRVVWSVVGGRMTHHNASAQIIPEGPARCRFVWIADLLPHELAPAITGMIEQGLAVIKPTLERAAGG
jgi:hypothetical protein